MSYSVWCSVLSGVLFCLMSWFCMLSFSVWCPVLSDVLFCLMSGSVWCPVLSDVLFCLMSGSVWYPVLSDILFCLISCSAWCPILSDVQFCLMSGFVCCPVLSDALFYQNCLIDVLFCAVSSCSVCLNCCLFCLYDMSHGMHFCPIFNHFRLHMHKMEYLSLWIYFKSSSQSGSIEIFWQSRDNQISRV